GVAIHENSLQLGWSGGRLLSRLCLRPMHRFLSRLERIGDAFPVWIAVASGIIDRLASPLQVAVPHRGVEVERSILDVLVQSHVLRSLVNSARRGASYIGTKRGNEERERVHE